MIVSKISSGILSKNFMNFLLEFSNICSLQRESMENSTRVELFWENAAIFPV